MTSEELEKQAQVELFLKAASEQNLDLDKLADAELDALFATFVSKLAESDGAPPEGKKKPKKDEREEDAEKELAEKKAEAKELAKYDMLGRHMARAYLDEIEKQAAARAEGSGEGKQASAADAVRKGLDVAKTHGARAKDAIGRGAAKAKGAVEKHLENVGKKTVGLAAGGGEGAMNPSTAKRIGAGVYGAGAAAAGGGAAAVHHATRDKKASALDELALERAVVKVAEAGGDVDVCTARLEALVTLDALGESTKVASASDLTAAVDVRALELLELAGYPVTWTEGA
jgi:hypothetical protein